jgi:uncharacterized YkwD family protein/spore coat assembly protein SafA
MKSWLKKCISAAAAFAVAFTIAALPQASAANTVHTVRSGDTMWKIAVQYRVGLSELIAANPNLQNPEWIYPNQQIVIPQTNTNQSWEQQVVQLVNAERTKAGLQPLAYDWELSRVARFKSEDMRDRNYFSHQSPTYGSPFDMMRQFGISYRTAGENIAAGQRSPQEVVNAWMNSPGHRANIMNANFTKIGVGLAKGGSYGYYWTQMFAG